MVAIRQVLASRTSGTQCWLRIARLMVARRRSPHVAANGITYTIESSTELEHWTSEGVTVTDPRGKLPSTSIPVDQAKTGFLLQVDSELGGER